MDGVISRRGVSVPPSFAAFVNSYHNVFLNAISHTHVRSLSLSLDTHYAIIQLQGAFKSYLISRVTRFQIDIQIRANCVIFTFSLDQFSNFTFFIN